MGSRAPSTEAATSRISLHHQLALDAAGLGWWRLDPIQQRVFLDPRAGEMLGASVGESTTETFLARVHCDDRTAFGAHLARALQHSFGPPLTARFRLDGSVDQWLEVHSVTTFETKGEEPHATDVAGTLADVSDRMRGADQARTILESMTDAFFAADDDWCVTYMNPKAERLLGRPSAELIGRSIWVEFPGFVGNEFETLYRRTTREKVAGSVTAFYPDHDRWYEVRTYPVRDGISVYFHDVSERKRAAEALEERSVLLRGISDSTSDVIYAKDRLGRIRFANPATLALIGKPLEAVLGKTDEELLEDKEAARRVMENDLLVMERGSPADLEEVVPLPDGTRRVWLSRKMPSRGEDGIVIGLLGVSRDITDQKRAWERLSRLYDVAAALSEVVSREDVARVTVHQGIEAAGATAGSLALLTEDGAHLELAGFVGYSSESIEPWRHFSVDANVPLAEAVRGLAPVFIESPEARLSQYPEWVTLLAHAPTRSSACIPLMIGGKAVGSLGLSFPYVSSFSADDRAFLTSLGRQCAQALERARLFAAEHDARNEAERASRMKDEFLATLSHELRTPLNAIAGWASILSEGRASANDMAKGLSTIQRNARAQTQIIEDLLDMNRIVSGMLRIDMQPTDIASVLYGAVDTLRSAADAKGVRLRTTIEPLIGPVRADPNRLQQIFSNLLQNAIKFTPRGGRVDVVLRRSNAHIEVSIADTGEGIAPDFLPYVFDRFRQADGSSTRRHGGLGLGLSIAKQLVELHGGTLSATSPGVRQGSTFVVALPFVDADEVEEARREPTSPPADDVGYEFRLTGLKVLVVDDEPDALEVVRRLFEARDAVVRTASSVDEAMSALAADRPDVIVSDIGMPGEDGYSFVRRVRVLTSDRSDIPAVALTASARTHDRVRALRAGFQSHVVKPVDSLELVAVVASVCGRAPKLG